MRSIMEDKMKKRHLSIGIAALALIAVVFLIFETPIGRYFSKEHRVDSYLKRYGINSDVGINLWVTWNLSKSINDRMTDASDPDRHRNSFYEMLMPAACRSEILRIYNSFHGSSHDILPIDKNNFTDYTIYRTSLQSMYGIAVTEKVHTPTGMSLGMPAEVETFTLFARKGDDKPALAYIVVHKIQDGSVDVLPIDMEQTEFAAYFNALRADYIAARSS